MDVKVTKGDRAALLAVLRECKDNGDTEAAHGVADDAIIAYIGDDEITQAYDAIHKWYA